MKYQTHDSFTMRKACKTPFCESTLGRIEVKNGQDCVYCCNCGEWQYNAHKVETGRAVRSTQTVHAAIKPRVRSDVLIRSNGRCELCGKSSSDCVVHVGHILSVNVGVAEGLSDDDINDSENLMAMCDECNLGIGDQPLPLKLMVKVLVSRLKCK